MDRDRLDGLACRIARRDPATRASLAADIYRHRGWSVVEVTTDREGDPTSTEAGDRRLRLVRSTGQRSGEADRPPRDILLPASGRAENRGQSSVEVVDPTDLARQVRYALPPEAANKLMDRYDLDPAWYRTMDRIPGPIRPIVRAIPGDPLRATGLVVMVVALLVAGALGSAVEPVPVPNTGTPADAIDTTTPPTPTAIPVTAFPLAAEEPGVDTEPASEAPILRPRHEDEAVAAYCPEPPDGVSPAALAPAVGSNASRLVLQSWRVRGGSTIADFDAASAAVRDFPITRWVGTYISTGGQFYHIAIDRWSTPAAARRAYLGLDGAGHAAIVWGSYVIRVDGYDRIGELLPGSMGTDEARILVMAIDVPGADRTLGTGCAKTLMGNPPS